MEDKTKYIIVWLVEEAEKIFYYDHYTEAIIRYDDLAEREIENSFVYFTEVKFKSIN